MSETQANLYLAEPVWTHQRVESSRPIRQKLESLGAISRYQRDGEIYQQESSVECWYRVISGVARRVAVRANGRRQIVDLLLPGDMFGFGVDGKHAFSAEAIAAGTAVARYPRARIDAIVAADPGAAHELREIVLEATSRLHSLLLILGRTTAEEKVGCFLLLMQARVGSKAGDRLVLPLSRYDVADYLALSVETVSRSLTVLKQRGVIALSGPRKIGIVDREALAEERHAGEATAPRPATERAASSRPEQLEQTETVEARVPGFAFADVLGDMRQWLDDQGCGSCRISCLRDPSGGVTVRAEFPKKSVATRKAFAQRFAALPGPSSA